MTMFTRQAAITAEAFPIAAKVWTGGDINHHPNRQGIDFSQSPIHQELNARWAWYAGSQYAGCRYNWQGAQLGPVSTIARALVPLATGVPPGFKNFAPPQLFERRPSAPHRLVARVVDRFTSLLFSEDTHPVIRVIGDEKTHHWVQSFIATSRLWAAMQNARSLGGGQGSTAVGLRVVEGQPRVEIFDLRWCKPVWLDKEVLKLKAFDVRYQIPATMKRDKYSQPETLFYWDRRLISAQADIRYKPVWCSEAPAYQLDDGTMVMGSTGEEPDWQKLIDEERSVRHDLGFCPVIWVQNIPNHESPYGYPDCNGLYEQAMSIDQLRASIDMAVIHNLDPTLIYKGPGSMPDTVRKGTGNGIDIPEGSELKYLEITGAGISIAMDQFEKARDNFFEEAECVQTFGKNDAPPQTAFEVSAKLGPQQSKQALLREQYGQHVVRSLLQMAIKMEQQLNTRGEGMILEPRVVKPEKEGDEEKVETVELGPGGYIETGWPPITRPTPTEVGAATTAAAQALEGQVIDSEAVIKYLAPYYGVDDVHALKNRMAKAKQEAQLEQDRQQEKLNQQTPNQPPGLPASSPA